MCNFMSGLVLRNGDVLTHPMLDSHSDLVTYFGLPDAALHHQHFAKVELTPVDWMQPDTWNFSLDEDTAPGWWDEVATRAEQTLRDRARAMIITTGVKTLIVDGCWIVGGTAEVSDVRAGRIVRVQGQATVHGVWGQATVSDVGGQATVSVVRGQATVRGVWGQATVRDVVGDRVTLDESAKARVTS